MLQLERFVPSLFAHRLTVPRRILVVNGHPDPRPERFCAALCEAYQEGAVAGGWEVRRLEIGKLSLWSDHPAPHLMSDLDMACEAIAWATQMLVVFPLWMEKPPPELLRLFEAYHRREMTQALPAANRLVHCVITMEMPAFLHRTSRHQANILDFNATLPGFFRQEREYIGSIKTMSPWAREDWLNTLRGHGLSAR
jgi:putative NADPH-quinone reductase